MPFLKRTYRRLFFLYLAIFPVIVICLIIVPKLLTIQEGIVSVGYEHIWSDWPLHISLASIFAFKPFSMWFSHHPFFASAHLNYPFVMDMLSGLLMRLGIPLNLAFILPTVIFLFLCATGWYFLSLLVTHSKLVALLSTWLITFSSGMGWVSYIVSHGLIFPDFFVSRVDQYDWYAGNIIIGLLLPQRAFLLGMVLGVWSLNALLFALKPSRLSHHRRLAILILSAVAAGLLPIVHVHSFISLIILSGCVCLASLSHWRLWLWYVAPSAILASILTLTFIIGSGEHHFLLLLGWNAKGGLLGWLSMWWQIWGAIIPLSVLGFFAIFRQAKLHNSHSLIFGFVILFALSNIVLFQPVSWDNSKIFVWVYLGLSIGSGYFLAWLFKRSNFLAKLIVIITILALSCSGLMDILVASRSDQSRQIGGYDDLSVGKYIKEHTAQNDVFLTGTSTNHPVMTWGNRSILMGFTPWVENFGFPTSEIYRDMKLMYGGNQPQLFSKYNISYVYIGAGEEYEFHPNEAYFATNYPLFYESSYARIYSLKP